VQIIVKPRPKLPLKWLGGANGERKERHGSFLIASVGYKLAVTSVLGQSALTVCSRRIAAKLNGSRHKPRKSSFGPSPELGRFFLAAPSGKVLAMLSKNPRDLLIPLRVWLILEHAMIHKLHFGSATPAREAW